MKTGLAIFEEFKIRRVYDDVTEWWYFSVVDIVRAEALAELWIQINQTDDNF